MSSFRDELDPTVIERIDTDIGHVPPALWLDDPIAQAEAYKAVAEASARSTDIEFKDAPVKSVLLSRLKSIHDYNSPDHALQLLQRRHRVLIDDEYIVDHDSPDLYWDLTQGALDFLLCVPLAPGLKAVLPNKAQDLTYVLKLNLRCRQKQFKSKHAKLGYDLVDSMLYIGESRNEEVYLCWMPVQVFDDPTADDIPPAGHSSGPSRLSYTNYLLTLLFLAYAMNKEGLQDVTLNPANAFPFPVATLKDVTDVTNILCVIVSYFSRPPIAAYCVYRHILDRAKSSYIADMTQISISARTSVWIMHILQTIYTQTPHSPPYP